MDIREKIGKAPNEREYLTVDEVKALADVPTGNPATKQAFMFFLQACAIAIWQIYAGDIQKTENGEVIHISPMQKTQRPVFVPFGIQAKNWMLDSMGCNLDDKVFSDVPTLGCSDRALKHMAKRAGIK